MPVPFVVAYVVGVTPGKWARVWDERMPQHPLELRVLEPDAAIADIHSGSAQVALVRLPVDSVGLSVISLYVEQPFVVAPKGHAIEALDTVTLSDLVGETVLEGGSAAWAANVELVAANVGVAVMPQSVARALSRRDVIARPVTDADTTQIALTWLADASSDLVEELVAEFVGIVRGRTANSSRGVPTPPTPPTSTPPTARAPKRAPRSGRPPPKPRKKSR